jgi:hypothetical protein
MLGSLFNKQDSRKDPMLSRNRMRITFCIIVFIMTSDGSDSAKVPDRVQSLLNPKTCLPPFQLRPDSVTIFNASSTSELDIETVRELQLDEGHKAQHEDADDELSLAKTKTGDYPMQILKSVSAGIGEEREEEEHIPISKRRKKRCGICLAIGHTKRKCTAHSRSTSTDLTLRREEPCNVTACRLGLNVACAAAIHVWSLGPDSRETYPACCTETKQKNRVCCTHVCAAYHQYGATYSVCEKFLSAPRSFLHCVNNPLSPGCSS